MTSVIIKVSVDPKKKYMAIFSYEDGKKKTVHFGATGYSDYIKSGLDEKKKMLYLARHKKNENWEIYDTSGSLSRYILWNKKTLTASITDYKKRFNLK
jgi:hypothetical protein